MSKIHKTTIIIKIIYGLLGIIFLLFGFFLLYFINPFQPICILFSIFLLAISIFFLVFGFNRKVTIEKDRLICINYFKKKSIKLNEIKGLRQDSKYLLFEHVTNKKLNLTIADISSFKKSDDIISWAIENFEDLDVIEFQIEEQRLLNDTTLGETKEKRKLLIKKANNFSIIYNLIGGLISFVLIFFDNYFSFFVFLILPLIGLFLIYYFDLIKFISNSKNSLFGSIIFVFFASSILLILKSSNFNLISFDKIWNPLLIFGFFIFLLLYVKGFNKSYNYFYGQLILMIFGSLIYSFGFIKGLNSVIDESNETIYKVKVIDQHISSGKSDSYFLTLDKWKFQNKNIDIKVSESFYNEIKSGDFVTLHLKQGYFNIPWFVISKNSNSY